MIELDMEFYLGNLSIDIKIWSKIDNKFIDAAAIFDTGAHITHVDTNSLRRLGYNLDNAGTGSVGTVGSGHIPINNIIIDNIIIGDLKTGAIFVNFSDLSNISCPVIIGLNIIKEFNVTLDFANMKMLLEPNFDVKSVTPADKFYKYDSRFGMWNIGLNNK